MNISSNFPEVYTHSTKRKKVGVTKLFRSYEKCNIPLLQPLINIFDKEINTNAYLAIIYEKMWYFSELKTCLFHLLKHVFFERKHGK